MSGAYWFAVFSVVLVVFMVAQLHPTRLFEAIIGCSIALGVLGTLEILGKKWM